MNQIRLLNSDEIECRVGTISEKGLSLLLYKDARADMKILDETFGAMNWERQHELIGDNLYCTVRIWDETKKQWISKMDVGTESYTEKEKGQASDSFKRACVSVGIGRELYSAPFIWISATKITIQRKNDRYITYDKFKVKEISYNKNREISGLVIMNQNGQVVYSQLPSKAETNRSITDFSGAKKTVDYEQSINRELERTGVALDTVLKRYKVHSIQEMSEETCQKAINSLKKTKSKAA